MSCKFSQKYKQQSAAKKKPTEYTYYIETREMYYMVNALCNIMVAPNNSGIFPNAVQDLTTLFNNFMIQNPLPVKNDCKEKKQRR